jgi:hypothetical protein
MSGRLDLSLRIAATLVLIGLSVELVSLSWHSPISFLVFVIGGGLAIAAGILIFFYSIVAVPRPKEGA